MAGHASISREPDSKPAVETRFHVRYHETDAMGVVHHAAYITWFEEGRSALTRALGYPYARLSGEGIDLAVVEVVARYLSPARYDDEVIVATRLTEFQSRAIAFGYEVRRAVDGALLVTGSSRHIAVDGEGRARRIPESFKAAVLAGGLAPETKR